MVGLFSKEPDMNALEFRGICEHRVCACLPLETVEDGERCQWEKRKEKQRKAEVGIAMNYVFPTGSVNTVRQPGLSLIIGKEEAMQYNAGQKVIEGGFGKGQQ